MLRAIFILLFLSFTAHAAYINEVTVLNFPATQAVTKSGTWNIDAIVNPVAVTGTFWQAVQPVSGSVSVSNFPATQAVTGTFWQATQPVSIASIPLATDAATLSEQQTQTTKITSVDNKLTTLSTVGAKTLGTAVISSDVGLITNSVIHGVTTGGGGGYVDVKVTPSGALVTDTTITGTLPLPTGAATLAEQQTQTGYLANIETNTDNINNKIPSGLTVTAGKLQVEIPSPLTVTGTFWQATQPVSLASIPLATGAATLAEQQTQTTALNNIGSYTQQVSHTAFTTVFNNGVGAGSAASALQVGGLYKSTPPTLTDGDASELNLDNKGNLKVSVENTVPTLNIGGVDINNWPALQLVAGTLPSVTGNDTDAIADEKLEDFLKIGGYDFDNGQARIAKFAGDNLQVQDSNSNSLLTTLVQRTRDPITIDRTVAAPAINYNLFTGIVSTSSWYDAFGMSFGTVSLSNSIANGSVILEGTNDNTSLVGTVIPMKIGNSITVAPVVAAVAVPIASTNYEFSIKYRYIRLRFTVASTGNVSAKFYLTPQPSENDNVYVTGGSLATTVSSGTITTVSTVSNVAAITPSVSAGGYPTYHTLISAATTNATLVKATAAMIGSISVSNTSGTGFYFKMFNLATAPVVGTTAPTFNYFIAANSTRDIPIPAIGTRFNLGLSYSTTANAATSDTTAIGAGQAIININYL